MRTVNELNENELEELRESYFQQLEDTDPEVLGDIYKSSQIPMSNIIFNYEGYLFSDDDFFCNLNN